jgi:hypothetical protein
MTGRPIARVGHALRWRLAALREKAAKRTSNFLPIVRELSATTQQGTLRAAADLIEAWRKHGIDPSNFAAMLLWDVPRSRWPDFVIGTELNRFLDATLDPEDRRLSRDKAAIAARDAALGLAWLPTLAVANRREGAEIDGAVAIDDPAELWPTVRALGHDRDLVLKPSCGRQGAGFFHVSTDGRARDGAGLDITPAALEKAVFSYKHSLGDYGYLLQEALVPHSEMVALTGVEELSTVRVVTALSNGVVDFIEIFLKIPAPGCLTDNFRYGSLGTMLASVDPTSGDLTALVGLLRAENRYVLERCAAHPATGRRIEGRTIPQWQDAIEISRRAALAHPRTATLGWDLALTPRGWIVLDFNPIWGPTGGEACTREGIRPILARLYPEAWR